MTTKKKRKASRPPAGLELDAVSASSLPKAAWAVGLRLYWLASSPRRRRRALQLLRTAACGKRIEPCLADIQKALAELHVDHLHAMQIVVSLYRLLAGPSETETVRLVAAEIRNLLLFFESIKEG